MIRNNYADSEYTLSVLQVVGETSKGDLLVEELRTDGVVIGRRLSRYNKYEGVMRRPEYSHNGEGNVVEAWVGRKGTQARPAKVEAFESDGFGTMEIQRAPSDELGEARDLYHANQTFQGFACEVDGWRYEWSPSFMFDGVLKRSNGEISFSLLDFGHDAKPFMHWSSTGYEVIS